MSWIAGVRARVRDMVFRRAAEERMDEEFQFHLEMQKNRNLRAGMPDPEATRQAKIAFGGGDRHRESMSDGRRIPLAEEFWRDVRYGARSLARTPGFTAICVITIALGIGLTAAMFSLMHGILFRGLPYEGGNRVVYVSHTIPSQGITRTGASAVAYRAYVRDQQTFDDLAAVSLTDVVIGGDGVPDRVPAAHVTANAFDVLNVSPASGRMFTTADEQGAGDRVAVIAHSLWQRRFGGDRAILGRSLRVDGELATIVGVMPAAFNFPGREEVWMPLVLSDIGNAEVQLYGRLRPGVSRPEAQVDLARIAATGFGDIDDAPEVVPAVQPFVDFILGDGPRGLLYTMFGAVVFVLLIACTNVANLLLGRSLVRAREVGIRSALGAGRIRVALQLLTESALLSVTGAALGVLLAYLAVRSFNGAFIEFAPAWMEIRVDRVILTFAVAVTALTALIAGLLPALRAARTDVRTVLSDDARGTSGFRAGRVSRGLVVFEIALSCGLLVAAGLTTRSMTALRSIDLGFDRTRVFTGELAVPEAVHPDANAFYNAIVDDLAQTRAFSRLALTTNLPGLGDGGAPLTVEGVSYPRAEDRTYVMRSFIGPDYLETLGVQVAAGRDIGPEDRPGSMPVALVTREFASRHFSGGSALGKRIRIGGDDTPWRTVIGIMPDVRFDELSSGQDDGQGVFVPLLQQTDQRRLYIIGRTVADPVQATGQVRAVLTDADIPLLQPGTLDDAIARDTWFITIFGSVFVVFGSVAFVMAMVGLYGVLSFSVGQRTREIGIRVAIGATRGQILSHVMRQGLVQVSIGLAAGILLAAGVSSLLAVILFDVNPRDPVVFGIVIACVLVAALAASFVPARRAASVHPVRALSM